MMRQSEFKMKFNPELGRFTRKHVYGEGITDVFKLVGKTAPPKQVVKKAVEKAVKTAATKTGKKFGDKIVQSYQQKRMVIR